ncbi:MAG: hypothetical protein AVDCRST_MAG41-3622 [uncultured Corynebacteriales bacterium]|uniref:Carboxypeptidase regulatory-like domain-containing protein n=1 Tax=uncultured Mycobacteriales bacterium TaxID=581187 RepID=A0A6J4JLT7_9ACTN|nr:MAG: hypothetical protein AVDCRST_MAG41-3622 [uncultured Corynebacteriales bacterium]
MDGSTIRGLVLDEQDWPIEGASVSLSALSPGGSAPDIAQLSSGAGRFTWAGLVEGRYEVSVRVVGFHPASAQTYAGVLTPARVDFHLTRISPAGRPHVEPPAAPLGGNPDEQVTVELDEVGGDVVEGSND